MRLYSLEINFFNLSECCMFYIHHKRNCKYTFCISIHQKLRSVFNSEIMGYTIFTLVFYPPICDLQRSLFFSIQHVSLLHLNSLKLSVFSTSELLERLSWLEMLWPFSLLRSFEVRLDKTIETPPLSYCLFVFPQNVVYV